MDILNKLQEIFRDVFDDETIVLTNETTANDIEDWDSLAQINLIVAIRREFQINFDLEEVSKYKNVGDIIGAIDKKINLKDKEIAVLIEKENIRQEANIELIASENYVSEDVLRAAGSCLTNKYGEGYPGQRYYGGCEYVDEIEKIAQERAKKLFNVEYVNVQPYSGSVANAAVYMALLEPNDTVLALELSNGGHLSHGYKISFSGKFYKPAFYYLNDEGKLDYYEILKVAKEVKPKMIICGYSAYSQIIDFKKFREIADAVGAYLFADISHISGLIIAKLHPSPSEYADVIMTTTHKTLRGTRGAIIMTNDAEIYKKINKAVFPGYQGGPLFHQIAAKAVSFYEALQPEFIEYQNQLLKNSKAWINWQRSRRNFRKD